ncbi:MAG: sensor histidine kinase, partial [Planctomycetota bacterium]
DLAILGSPIVPVLWKTKHDGRAFFREYQFQTFLRKCSLECNTFNIAAVASECIELVQPLAEQRGATIEADLPPAQINGDASRIAQVLTNLLSNAVRYNRDGGSVRVSATTDNEEVAVKISDTGIGIPREELPHIYDRFYRVDKARSRANGGSGLGLSICRTIVEAHGGTITAQSESEAGTTFEIRLPLSTTPGTLSEL